MRLKGITVRLYTKTQTGTDDFGRPVYSENAYVDVANVLVAPASAQETLDVLNLTGKRVEYTLGIPKGDTNDWKDKKISFFGQTFRSFGDPLEGIDDLIPLGWNKKVTVEKYG